jgi:hypothetical protein
MLHLFPIRRLLSVILALVALAVLAAVYAGIIGTGDAFEDVNWIIRWASFAATCLLTVPYVAWRWIPNLQRFTFPYLGGHWAGELNFHGPKGPGTRQVTLTISHSLLRIVLILDSDESTSRTLVVHAERDVGVSRDRLYYVYMNERKEGVAGGGQRYRGLAVLRAEMSQMPELLGDYFTETQSTGTIRLTRSRSHPWWAVWK